MNLNTNLSFIESHSFPFFSRQKSTPPSVPSTGPKLPHEARLERKERRKRQLAQTRQCCKRFFTFLFSHIGLSAVLIGYIILGGLMFQAIEVKEEQIVKKTVISNRTQFVKEVVQYHLNFLLLQQQQQQQQQDQQSFGQFNVSNETRMFLENVMEDVLENYTKNVIHFMQEKGWNGFLEETNLNWSFEGALLYVITVITTIANKGDNPFTLT